MNSKIEKQEPVAYLFRDMNSGGRNGCLKVCHITPCDGAFPVYTAPQPCPECGKLKAELALTKTLSQQSNQDHLNARLDYQGEIIGLKAERDELAEKLKYASMAATAEAHRCDELAAQVEKMRATLEAISMSSLTHQRIRDYVEKALALPDLSTSILNKVRAEALRKAAAICNELCEPTLLALAADMEAGKC